MACNTVALSHYHTVTLSHCHTVSLSHCHILLVVGSVRPAWWRPTDAAVLQCRPAGCTPTISPTTTTTATPSTAAVLLSGSPPGPLTVTAAARPQRSPVGVRGAAAGPLLTPHRWLEARPGWRMRAGRCGRAGALGARCGGRGSPAPLD